MKCFSSGVVLIVLLLLPFVMPARHIAKLHSNQSKIQAKLASTRTTIEVNKSKSNYYLDSEIRRRFKQHRKPDTLQIAGSSLPDCSHACGSCRPCRLVMVSFVCATIAEAETCPMAYKCMCNNKSYPVP